MLYRYNYYYLYNPNAYDFLPPTRIVVVVVSDNMLHSVINVFVRVEHKEESKVTRNRVLIHAT